MKTSYGIILVLAMAMAVVSAGSRAWGAEEQGQEDIWLEYEPRRGSGRWQELTDESIKHIMERLAEVNPAKAAELAKLRDKNPEEFKAELTKTIREEFRQRLGEQRGQMGSRRGEPGPNVPVMGPGGPGEPGRRGWYSGRRREERMRERYAEHLEWLETNEPEEAQKLAALKEKEPGLYLRQIAISFRKWRRIQEAEKDNPELAQVLKEDLPLRDAQGKLIRKIKAAGDDDEKKELIEELKEVLSDRFDLIVRRKQIEYEQLLEKLKKLQEEIEKSKAKVEKWKNAEFKEENVKAHLEALISETQKFPWH